MRKKVIASSLKIVLSSTDKQIEHRARFGMALEFVKNMEDLLEISYKGFTIDKTGQTVRNRRL
jgi:hypothetical protein